MPKRDSMCAREIVEEIAARKVLFERMDLDHDGSVTRDEWDQAFSVIDENGDGHISRKEWYIYQGTTAVFDAIEKKSYAVITRDEWSKAFDQLDANKDSFVSLDEMYQAGGGAAAKPEFIQCGSIEGPALVDLLKEASYWTEIAEMESVIKWSKAWSEAGLPNAGEPSPEQLASMMSSVYVDNPVEGLLPEEQRLRACDPTRFQLVYLSDCGLEVETYDRQEEAEQALAALKADDSGEGGGVLFQGKTFLGEKLFLKHMLKEDYAQFLESAREAPPTISPAEQAEACKRSILEGIQSRMSELADVAPTIAMLRSEYEAKGITEPERVRGRPSIGLVEFARLYPNYVTLGGCVMDDDAVELADIKPKSTLR